MLRQLSCTSLQYARQMCFRLYIQTIERNQLHVAELRHQCLSTMTMQHSQHWLPGHVRAAQQLHRDLQPVNVWHAFKSSGQRCWQHSHGFKTAADRARARSRKGIIDGGLYLGAVVLGMLGLSYASVPLYRAFCQATGYGGTLSQTHNIEAKLKAREENPNAALEERAKQREIRVWFSADVADDMPWKFTPTQDYVTVHPGESVLAFFTAKNKSPHAITGVSTYNVVPDKAAYYFNKIQCFCFEEQRLRAGEEVDMPVFFYLDPEMVDDFNCRNIHDITLSYTFFKVDEDEDATAAADAAGGSGIKLHGPGQLPATLGSAVAAEAKSQPQQILPQSLTPAAAGSS